MNELPRRLPADGRDNDNGVRIGGQIGDWRGIKGSTERMKEWMKVVDENRGEQDRAREWEDEWRGS